MKIIWLGHSSFRFEIGDAVILLDPWLGGNPSFPDERRAEAVAGATHILLTHGHFDHASEVVDLAKELSVPVVGQFDLMQHWENNEGLETVGFNKGGTVEMGPAKVTMVHATHSSTMPGPHGPVSTGSEAGYISLLTSTVCCIAFVLLIAYQWRKNGVDINGASNATYTISNLNASHAGSYQVVVSNAWGSATSAKAVLTIGIPPTIALQPVDQNATAGTGVTFAVDANGSAPLAYQWQKNGVNLVGATAKNLVLSNLDLNASGAYRAVVTNDYGTATSSAATMAVSCASSTTRRIRCACSRRSPIPMPCISPPST